MRVSFERLHDVYPFRTDDSEKKLLNSDYCQATAVLVRYLQISPSSKAKAVVVDK